MKRSGVPSGATGPMHGRLTLLIAGTAALGVALVLAREAAFGVWLTGDSFDYIAVARSLLAGEGFTDHEADAFVYWPPGYPLLLAAASLGVFEPTRVAGPLNAALFGLTIFVTGHYLHGRLRLRPLAAWAGLAIALAAPLASTAAMAMSEPAFILLAVLALVRTDDYLARGRTASLAWAALFAALAWQMRYVGVAVPVAVGLAVLLQPGATRWQRARRASFVWLVSVLLMAPWMVRSYLAFGGRPYTLEETVKVLGRGHPTHGIPYPLDEVLAGIGSGLGSWAPFGPSPPGWPSFALLAVAAVALVWAGSGLVHGPRMPRASDDRRTFSIWGGFALAYLVLLTVGIARGNTLLGMHDRYMAPMYVPCLVVLVLVVDRLLGSDRGRKRSGGVGILIGRLSGLGRFGRGGASLPGVVVAAGLALWLAANADRSLSEILRANSGEMFLRYSKSRWMESGTLRYIRDNPIDGRVYSNEAALLSLHNGGTATYRWVGGVGEGVPLRDGATVVWFRNWWGHSAGAGDLLVSPRLALLAELDDGLIFRVDSRPAFDVELTGKTLTYRKAPCAPEDVRGRFILKVRPVNAADLPAHRSGKPYDRLGFDFGQHGAIRDGECRATVTLPDYDVAYVETGQRTKLGLLWSAWLVDGDTVKGAGTPAPPPRPNPYRAARAAIAAGDFGAPVRPREDEDGSESSHAFDLHLRDGTLAYLKEPCAAGDTAARFFLHVFPADPAELPAYRRKHGFDRYGFDNRDFRFEDFGIRFDSRWGRTCLALVRLPGYGIASLRTGQFVSGAGAVWKAEIERP